VTTFISLIKMENGGNLMLIKFVTRLGLKDSKVLLMAYRIYISIRYKNLFDQIIKFRDIEVIVGRDLSLFPSLIRGDFENKELQLISKLQLKAETVIWDIGANVGVYSILFSKWFPKSTIVCFEPSDPTFKLLTLNLSHNKCKNVLPFNCGLGDSLEPQFLKRSSLGAGSNSIVLKGEPQKIHGEEIHMTTIEDFISKKPNLLPEFIKIDVEGFEPQVIMGGSNFISTQKPIIMMEVFPLLWVEEAYEDWRLCLDFLFNTYGKAFELRDHKSGKISTLKLKDQDQRTLFFGLSEHERLMTTD
jgi:FkbM family methyltransferase